MMIHHTKDQKFHVHLVSDSTGDTIFSVARACLSQFAHQQYVEHFWNLVRTDRQMDFVIESIEKNPGFVMYTLVDEKLRDRLKLLCQKLNLPIVPVLEPLMHELTLFFGAQSVGRPGRQYVLNDKYFNRIEAIEYTLMHDDGQLGPDLYKADIILVGVSRSSKTPTCMYLANRGYRVANFPYVPGCPLPPILFDVTKPLIVGLTKDPENLVEIRRNRLKLLNQGEHVDYVDLQKVKEEVLEARRFYRSHKWPVVDVTRRSIEETAAEIIMLLQRRDLEKNSPTSQQEKS